MSVKGSLKVEVLSGKGLRSRAGLGKSQSPLVKLKVFDAAGVTIVDGQTGPVVKGGKNPTWSLADRNVVTLPFEAASTRLTMWIEVFASDNDKFVGGAMVELASHLRTAQAMAGAGDRPAATMATNLTDRSGRKACGVLHYKLRCTMDAPEAVTESEAESGAESEVEPEPATSAKHAPTLPQNPPPAVRKPSAAPVPSSSPARPKPPPPPRSPSWKAGSVVAAAGGPPPPPTPPPPSPSPAPAPAPSPVPPLAAPPTLPTPSAMEWGQSNPSRDSLAKLRSGELKAPKAGVPPPRRSSSPHRPMPPSKPPPRTRTRGKSVATRSRRASTLSRKLQLSKALTRPAALAYTDGLGANEGVLAVTVVSGRSLRNREMFGKQDPYVLMTLLDTDAKVLSEGRTATVKKGGRDPTWTPGEGDSVDLPYSAPPDAGLLLTLTVMDEEVASKDDLIGRGEVNLAHVTLGSTTPIPVPLKNSTKKKDCGTLFITVAMSQTYVRNLAATGLQTAYRARKARQEYAKAKSGAVILQATWRGKAARDDFSAKRYAAIRFQAAYRCRVAHRHFQSQRQASVAVQTRWRGHAARTHYARQRHAAAVLSHTARGYVARSRYARQRAASTMLQASYRGHLARMELQAMHIAAAMFQSIVRRRLARREYLASKSSACLIQASFRGASARGHYHKQRAAAVMFQAAVRRRRARMHFLEQRQACVALQSQFRGHAARTAHARRGLAAVKVQAWWRSLAALRGYREHRRAALVLQAQARGWSARRDISARRGAASRLQHQYRGYATRRDYAAGRRAVVAMQAGWRGHHARFNVALRHVAASYFQAAWRGMLYRRQVAVWSEAVTPMQAAWRGYNTRVYLEIRDFAAALLQSVWRMYVCRADFDMYVKAAAAIQAAWKGYLVRGELVVQHCAAMVIQAAWRQHTASFTYARNRAAAVVVQTAVRGFLARRHMAFSAFAAKMIQAAARGRFARNRIAGTLEVCVTGGRRLRSGLLSKTNPYVCVELVDADGQALAAGRTQAVPKGGKNPEWTPGLGNTLLLPFRGQASLEAALRVEVWHSDASPAAADSLLGVGSLPVTAFLGGADPRCGLGRYAARPPAAVTVPLTDRGESSTSRGTLTLFMSVFREAPVATATTLSPLSGRAASVAAVVAAGGALKAAPPRRGRSPARSPSFSDDESPPPRRSPSPRGRRASVVGGGGRRGSPSPGRRATVAAPGVALKPFLAGVAAPRTGRKVRFGSSRGAGDDDAASTASWEGTATRSKSPAKRRLSQYGVTLAAAAEVRQRKRAEEVSAALEELEAGPASGPAPTRATALVSTLRKGMAEAAAAKAAAVDIDFKPDPILNEAYARQHANQRNRRIVGLVLRGRAELARQAMERRRQAAKAAALAAAAPPPSALDRVKLSSARSTGGTSASSVASSVSTVGSVAPGQRDPFSRPAPMLRRAYDTHQLHNVESKLEEDERAVRPRWHRSNLARTVHAKEVVMRAFARHEARRLAHARHQDAKAATRTAKLAEDVAAVAGIRRVRSKFVTPAEAFVRRRPDAAGAAFCRSAASVSPRAAPSPSKAVHVPVRPVAYVPLHVQKKRAREAALSASGGSPGRPMLHSPPAVRAVRRDSPSSVRSDTSSVRSVRSGRSRATRGPSSPPARAAQFARKASSSATNILTPTTADPTVRQSPPRQSTTPLAVAPSRVRALAMQHNVTARGPRRQSREGAL